MTRSAIPLLITMLALAPVASPRAQTTDGYHLHQVFPVVVDTASFTQRFHLDGTGSVSVKYFPAQGTSQATPLDCGTVDLAATGTFASLRSLCPGLAAGSQFGMLVVRQNVVESRFAGFSRVSNPQGNGFSVEAFPLHVFTGAELVVSGLRRLAASGGAPAFQTNCFVGMIPNNSGTTVPTGTVRLAVSKFDGTPLGSTDLALAPGQVVRLLDVFAAVGTPPGDQPDAYARITPIAGQAQASAVVAFCTVQDNTSFGADFRIAKQEIDNTRYGPRDDSRRHKMEETATLWFNVPGGGQQFQAFEIPAGNYINTHVLYLRHPDYVSCALGNLNNSQVHVPAYGLEMRLTSDGNTIVGGGGNDAVQFVNLRLPDRVDSSVGQYRRFLLEVESNGQNAGALRQYFLRCTSGNGQTRADLVRHQEAAAPRF